MSTEIVVKEGVHEDIGSFCNGSLCNAHDEINVIAHPNAVAECVNVTARTINIELLSEAKAILDNCTIMHLRAAGGNGNKGLEIYDKVRVNKAKVVAITDIVTGGHYQAAIASYDETFQYVVGETVVSDFKSDNTTCAAGIHGFLSKKMALAHKL